MSLNSSTRLLAVVLVGLGVAAADARNWLFGTGVIEEAVLIPTNRRTSDVLGYQVAMDGEILVGGAPFATLGGVVQPGRAFVYELDNEGLWQHTKTLRPSIIQPFAFFGLELTMHGNTIAVSSIGEADPRDRAGAVYVFEKSGGTWTETQRVVPSDRNFLDLFGGGMSLTDDTLVIGSVGHATPSGRETGATFIFERQAGVWTQSAMLYPAVGTPFGNFGFDSAIVGNTVVVGALADDNRGFFRAGAVFVFELTGGGGWTETAKLLAPDPSERAELGMSVGMDESGTTIVGGAPTAVHEGVVTGAVYVYDLIDGEWQLTEKLTAPDASSGARFGLASAISGDTILVGAFLDSENGPGAGAAYVYRRVAGEWLFAQKIVASTPGRLNYGFSVALQNDRAVIGAPFHTLNRGALYVYTGLAGCDQPCDMNCDGEINSLDIEPFLGLLFGGSQPCNTCTGDVNGDGTIDALDIEPFLECLFQ